MPRFLALVVAASTAIVSVSTAALAAPRPERVRGTVKAISGQTLTVHTTAGPDALVALTGVTSLVPGIGGPLGATASNGGLSPQLPLTMPTPGFSPVSPFMSGSSSPGGGMGNGSYIGSGPSLGTSIGNGLSPSVPSPSPGFPISNGLTLGPPSPPGTGFPNSRTFVGVGIP